MIRISELIEKLKTFDGQSFVTISATPQRKNTFEKFEIHAEDIQQNKDCSVTIYNDDIVPVNDDDIIVDRLEKRFMQELENQGIKVSEKDMEYFWEELERDMFDIIHKP